MNKNSHVLRNFQTRVIQIGSIVPTIKFLISLQPHYTNELQPIFYFCYRENYFARRMITD